MVRMMCYGAYDVLVILA